MYNSCILGIGAYLPKKILTNHQLSQTVDTTHEWILKRTGIVQRYIAAENELTSDLAILAASKALKDASIKAEDVGLIIVATTTPDYTFPSCAVIVQEKLGCNNAFAFDIQAACSGFIYALSVANNFIKTGQVSTALVIGAETMSKIVDWTDRSTCILFGDGAGAVVLSNTPNTSGIISSHLYSDGSCRDILYTNGGVSSTRDSGTICMAGPTVFEHAIEKLSSAILTTLSDNNLTIHDIDWLLPHQANIRIIMSVASKLGFPLEKVIITVDNHANTSAASIPLALYHAKLNGQLKKNDLILMAAIGAGLTWGTVLSRY